MTTELRVLRDFIADELGYEGELGPEIDLLEHGILDSFSVVEVAAFVQKQFDLELEAEDLVRENFATLSSIVALIDKRRH